MHATATPSRYIRGVRNRSVVCACGGCGFWVDRRGQGRAASASRSPVQEGDALAPDSLGDRRVCGGRPMPNDQNTLCWPVSSGYVCVICVCCAPRCSGILLCISLGSTRLHGPAAGGGTATGGDGGGDVVGSSQRRRRTVTVRGGRQAAHPHTPNAPGAACPTAVPGKQLASYQIAHSIQWQWRPGLTGAHSSGELWSWLPLPIPACV